MVVSLFVNPLQFGPTEDLAAYPRDLDGDAAVAEAEGVDVLFAPTRRRDVPAAAAHDGARRGPHRRVCAARRGPTHFDGVTTVVAKLFSMVGPCRAYFGRKDAQQLAVVRRMAADLDLPVDVVGCPLVREPDGLAMSSRNAYLDADERRAASVLVAVAAGSGARGHRGRARRRRGAPARSPALVATEPRVELEYAEVVDAAALEPMTEIDGDVLVAVAAQVGRARLIDNMAVSVGSSGVDVDLGVVAPESGRGVAKSGPSACVAS